MTLKRLSVVLLACLTLSACGGVDPNSPLGQRKAIFKQMLKTGEDLGGMLRGRIPFDGPKFADGAVKLDALSREPVAAFSAGARRRSHQRQERCLGAAGTLPGYGPRPLKSATGELVIASKVQPYKASNLGPAVQKVEDACSACHKTFRDH